MSHTFKHEGIYFHYDQDLGGEIQITDKRGSDGVRVPAKVLLAFVDHVRPTPDKESMSHPDHLCYTSNEKPREINRTLQSELFNAKEELEEERETVNVLKKRLELDSDDNVVSLKEMIKELTVKVNQMDAMEAELAMWKEDCQRDRADGDFFNKQLERYEKIIDRLLDK